MNNKWNYRYTCKLCGRTFRGTGEEDLRTKINEHLNRNHGEEPGIDEKELLNNIEKQ